MKTLIALLFLAAVAAAAPMKRVTNREFPDGSGSSKETDPEKFQAVETFYDSTRKVTHKVVYQLDGQLLPQSAIFYTPKNVVYQKSTFKLDGQERIIQEVIYDANGNLIQSPRQSGSSKKRR